MADKVKLVASRKIGGHIVGVEGDVEAGASFELEADKAEALAKKYPNLLFTEGQAAAVAATKKAEKEARGEAQAKVAKFKANDGGASKDKAKQAAKTVTKKAAAKAKLSVKAKAEIGKEE